MPVNTLVEHWKGEKDSFGQRKADAETARDAAAKSLAAAKDALAAEDKVLTDLTKEIADTRAAFAGAGPVDAKPLAQQLIALIVRQHDSEGRRLKAGKTLDDAQVDADVAAEQLADAGAGLGEATAKLAAAETAQAKRDERSQKAKSKEFQEAVAKASEEAATSLADANERLKVVPDALQAAARRGYEAEAAALQKAKDEAAKAEDEARKAAAPAGGEDQVEVTARAFAVAEEKLRARLESTLVDLARATASLRKVAGDEKDPPLLSKAEKEAIDAAGAPAATPAPGYATPVAPAPATAAPAAGTPAAAAEPPAAGGAASTYEARTPAVPARAAKGETEPAPPEGSAGPGRAPVAAKDAKAKLIELARAAGEKARAYDQKVAEKKKAAKPGEDVEADPEVVEARQARDAAAKAYDDTVKAFPPPADVLLPDKAWQAVLDVVEATETLKGVKDGTSSAELVKGVETALAALAQEKTKAADRRRSAEDKKHAAHRAKKRFEKAQAAYASRLRPAARGDL